VPWYVASSARLARPRRRAAHNGRLVCPARQQAERREAFKGDPLVYLAVVVFEDVADSEHASLSKVHGALMSVRPRLGAFLELGKAQPTVTRLRRIRVERLRHEACAGQIQTDLRSSEPQSSGWPRRPLGGNGRYPRGPQLRPRPTDASCLRRATGQSAGLPRSRGLRLPIRLLPAVRPQLWHAPRS
jgi:hypothetical protein